jgi:hypothetical protein
MGQLKPRAIVAVMLFLPENRGFAEKNEWITVKLIRARHHGQLQIFLVCVVYVELSISTCFFV